ncbi:MAG: hypothetical protein QME51_05420 [Planctomycetota bacterium]|nr:hypothetical protein [Planctomycetota bacterium]MDI6787791.1 hypothetical protein [Planctomycetota bacterium]
MNNKVVIVALVVIIVVGVLGLFGSYHLYKYYQDKLSGKIPNPTRPNDRSHSVGRESEIPNPKSEIQTVGSPTSVEGPVDMEFQMTGGIVLPQLKSAIILNTLTNVEQIYQEGNFLDSQKSGRWTVVNITDKEVFLQQYYNDGSVAREHILKLTPKSGEKKPSDTKVWKPGEKKALPKIGESVNLRSPEEIEKVISGTSVDEILGILKDLPDSFIEAALSIMPAEYLRNKITESPLGLMVTDETFKNIKPAEIVNNLRKVALDYNPKGEKLIVFATRVNPDNNSPISPTDVFPPETKRIFACFRNQGPLAKLDRVIIKWVDTTTPQLVYWSAYLLNPDAEYNYIFLKPEGRWGSGKYFALLYKQIQDIEPSAYGEFEIR